MQLYNSGLSKMVPFADEIQIQLLNKFETYFA